MFAPKGSGAGGRLNFNTAFRLAAAGAVSAAILAAAPAFAASWLLASPDPRVAPGQSFSVILVSLPGGAPAPDELDAVLELGDEGPRIALGLVAAGAEESGQRRYIGHWPQEVVGVATLALRDTPSARVLLDARAGSRPVLAEQGTGGIDPSAPVVQQTASSEPSDPGALGFHEPMYFVVGGETPRSARFQFSFRYRIFDDQGVVAEMLPMVQGLYFGFTQTSIWDLESESRPFRDTSFRPSLFYNWRLSHPEKGGWLALSGGYEHESNGKEGLESRSIDTLFVRAEGRHYLSDRRTYIGIAPKLWSYLDKEDNRDIDEYRGFGELGFRVGRDDGLMLSAIVRGRSGRRSGRQFDLSYPLRQSVFSGVGAFLHLQYFTGYGETLHEYDVYRRPQWRFGISLVR